MDYRTVYITALRDYFVDGMGQDEDEFDERLAESSTHTLATRCLRLYGDAWSDYQNEIIDTLKEG